MHHALGVTGGAGGEKHGGRVIGMHLRHRIPEKVRMPLRVSLTRRLQRVHGLQAVLGVIAQTAWIVVVNVGELGRVLAHLQKLIHLFLVLSERKADLGVIDRKHTFRRDGILVQRHRNGTQRLHRQHGGVQARPVGTDDNHMLAPAQASLVQTCCQLLDHGSHIRPIERLPDAVFLFAHGRSAWALAGVL